MRRAATLFFVALLAAPVFAQTPAAASNPAITPSTQTSPGSGQPADPGTAANGQAANPAGVQNGAAPAAFDQISAGTEIRATLDTPLSTKTSRPGDRFTATITEPAHGSNGSVVVPPGARVEGEVADTDENKELTALRGKGKLSLRFRDLVLPSGQMLPLSATLISVNDTNNKHIKKSSEETQILSGARQKDAARDASAGIGAPAGLVFGSPLKGLAIGALAGGGYVLATKGKEVVLPAQTGMVIRLDQPLSGSGTAAPQPR